MTKAFNPEPDNAGFEPSTNQDGSPRPQRKPPHESSYENDALARAAKMTSTLSDDELSQNHPYGDSGHGMGTGEALRRLGAAGQKYGEQ